MSPDAATTAHTARVLGESGVGERLWFFFCSEVPAKQPRLLLTTLRDDPKMTALLEASNEVAVPLGADVHLGLLTIGTNGSPWLASQRMDAGTLVSLALWTQAQVGTHPELALLKGTSFVNVDADARVTSVVEDASLWEGLPERHVPGTPGASARRLDELGAEDEAFYWLTDRGSDGLPAFALSLRADDPEAEALHHQLVVLRGDGLEVTGILRLAESGKLVLTSSSAIEDIQATANAYVSAHGHRVPKLEGARLVAMSADKVVATGVARRLLELERESEILSELPQKNAWFWFTDSDTDGTPRLALHSERDALTGIANGLRGPGQDVLGSLRWHKGFPLFVSRKTFAGFLPSLADWAGRHLGACPELSRLKHARLIVQNEKGFVVERHRDDGSWRHL